MNFFKKFEVKRSIIKDGREMGNYVLMWNILGEQVSTMENVEEFLRFKTPQ